MFKRLKGCFAPIMFIIVAGFGSYQLYNVLMHGELHGRTRWISWSAEPYSFVLYGSAYLFGSVVLLVMLAIGMYGDRQEKLYWRAKVNRSSVDTARRSTMFPGAND